MNGRRRIDKARAGDMAWWIVYDKALMDVVDATARRLARNWSGYDREDAYTEGVMALAVRPEWVERFQNGNLTAYRLSGDLYHVLAPAAERAAREEPINPLAEEGPL